MNKEEILEKSKEENKNKDMYAIAVEAKGATIAGISVIILTGIYYIYEIISEKRENPALYSIITVYNAILFGYKAIKIKKQRKLYVLTSLIWGLLSILLILNYFKVI